MKALKYPLISFILILFLLNHSSFGQDPAFTRGIK